jgi:hypothetical protein
LHFEFNFQLIPRDPEGEGKAAQRAQANKKTLLGLIGMQDGGGLMSLTS